MTGQINSLTMIAMLHEHHTFGVGVLAMFFPMIELLTAINQPIDIVNATKFKNGKNLVVEKSDGLSTLIFLNCSTFFDFLRSGKLRLVV